MKELKISNVASELLNQGILLVDIPKYIVISNLGIEVLNKGVSLSDVQDASYISNIYIEVLSKGPDLKNIQDILYVSGNSIEVLSTYIPPEDLILYPYNFSGTVLEDINPVNRTIFVYDQEKLSLINKTESSHISGSYTIGTTISGNNFIICVDDNDGADYNDLIIASIKPTV